MDEKQWAKVFKNKQTNLCVILETQEYQIRILGVVYDQNHYFGLGLIPEPKPKLADTFGR